MRNFLLITNPYKDMDLRLTNEILEYIRARGGSASYLLSNIRRKGRGDFDVQEVPEGTECILVLGGDGTLIRAATEAESLRIPLIGVNLGTLGYLCELTEATVFTAIDRLMNGEYVTEERMLLTGYQGSDKSDARVALNDIVIHREGPLSILSLVVYVNGKLLNTYHADGVIVATPTGSTGYSMSAGGPIVDPKTSLILLTPINAHNLNSKSIVLGPDDVIEIEIGNRRAEADECASVSFDGDEVARIAVGERFVISRSDNTTQICKLNNRSFLELLGKKMQTYN